MTDPERRDKHDRLLFALEHPLRRRILRLMSDERKISPREIADELCERLNNVSYHVRVLLRCGAIRAAGLKPVRGATQHFYRWSLEEPWAREILDETEGEFPQDQS